MNMRKQKCKGFWNMCGCLQCRKAARQLANATEAEKQAARQEAVTHLNKRNKNGPYTV